MSVHSVPAHPPLTVREHSGGELHIAVRDAFCPIAVLCLHAVRGLSRARMRAVARERKSIEELSRPTCMGAFANVSLLLRVLEAVDLVGHVVERALQLLGGDPLRQEIGRHLCVADVHQLDG